MANLASISLSIWFRNIEFFFRGSFFIIFLVRHLGTYPFFFFFADNALLKIIRFCWDKNTAWLMNTQQSMDVIEWDVWLLLQKFEIIFLSVICAWTNWKKLQFYKDSSDIKTMSRMLSCYQISSLETWRDDWYIVLIWTVGWQGNGLDSS